MGGEILPLLGVTAAPEGEAIVFSLRFCIEWSSAGRRIDLEMISLVSSVRIRKVIT